MARLPPSGILLVLLAVGGGALLFNYFYQQLLQQRAGEAADQATAALVGKPRPDFSLPDLDGFPREISEWDGHTLVLNFWASWCVPCRREMPAFVELQREYADRGVQFIGVAVDRRPAVEEFLQELGVTINYPILIGEDDAIEIAQAYGNSLGVLPYTVLVDRAGRIAHLQYGEIKKSQLRELLEGVGDKQ